MILFGRQAWGRTVRLGAVKLGGQWVTTPAAIARFVTALSGPGSLPLAIRTADDRQAADERELCVWWCYGEGV